MENQLPNEKPPIINCHAHIFTSDYVPPYLTKTFLPEPFYRILNISKIVVLVKWWFNNEKSPYKWPYQRWYIRLKHTLYKIRIALVRYTVLAILKFFIGFFIFSLMFYELYSYFIKDWMISNDISTKYTDIVASLIQQPFLEIITENWWIKSLLLIILFVFFPSGRNLLLFILRKFSKFIGMLPGKESKELIKRYMNIVHFARYKDQFRIFSRLQRQYPNNSGMVVLPMDMEFMGAGKPLKTFEQQMQELAAIKNNHPKKIYPFVFVDPRRTKVGSEKFFDYRIQKGKVILEPCFIKTYIEEHKFSGFKIYPALGYYPFDEKLLPLWKYAADNGIPIMTHCIRGTIFYRGSKEKSWDEHPVFEQYEGNQDDDPKNEQYFKPLLLPQIKAQDVQEIFTHPMNYACLLKKEWLAKLVGKSKDKSIHELFGYNKEKETIENDLGHLKICFAHFGGDEEWVKFMEKDRDNWAHQLNVYPDRGIDFLNANGKASRIKAEQLWKYTDWYSLICSMMLQHDNVYADISYILHSDTNILPLLRQTLKNSKLKKTGAFWYRLLCGTKS